MSARRVLWAAGLFIVTGWIGTASAAVQVGVADTGVAPNLGGQVAPGWNFLANSADTSDLVWHGTFVAGLVQAEAQSAATIVPLRVCNLANVSSAVPPANCTGAALAKAITYAGSHGIPIVNASNNLGSGPTALKTAIQSNPNVLIVAAAGNGTSNIDTKPQYPCSFKLPNVICVTASGANDVLWKKANYGQTVQLAAPGVNIAGRTPWTAQTYPANLAAGTNCEVQFKMKGSASPLTITGTNGTTTATIATWSGSITSLKTATWLFPASLQGTGNVTVSFTGASGLTIQNLIAQCQGPTTQPFTSSGGSFAAATVSGAAAILETQFPQATTSQIVAALLNGATTDVTPAGKIQGNRELNLNGAIQQLTTTP
jgi:Subtilase family